MSRKKNRHSIFTGYSNNKLVTPINQDVAETAVTVKVGSTSVAGRVISNDTYDSPVEKVGGPLHGSYFNIKSRVDRENQAQSNDKKVDKKLRPMPRGISLSQKASLVCTIPDGLCVRLTPKAVTQLFGYGAQSPVEISLIGVVERHKEEFLVSEFFLLEQEGGEASTEIGEEQLSALIMRLIQENRKEDVGKLRCWAHTHPGMGAFWSQTDDQMCGLFATDWAIALVCNEIFEIRCRIDLNSLGIPITIDNVPVVLDFLPQDRMKELKDELDRTVKIKQPETTDPTFSPGFSIFQTGRDFTASEYMKSDEQTSVLGTTDWPENWVTIGDRVTKMLKEVNMTVEELNGKVLHCILCGSSHTVDMCACWDCPSNNPSQCFRCTHSCISRFAAGKLPALYKYAAKDDSNRRCFTIKDLIEASTKEKTTLSVDAKTTANEVATTVTRCHWCGGWHSGISNCPVAEYVPERTMEYIRKIENGDSIDTLEEEKETVKVLSKAETPNKEVEIE